LLRAKLQQLHERNTWKFKQHRLMKLEKMSLADVPAGCKDSTDSDLFEVMGGLRMHIASFRPIGCDGRAPKVGTQAAVQVWKHAAKTRN
jgi:hypothetical protein